MNHDEINALFTLVESDIELGITSFRISYLVIPYA